MLVPNLQLPTSRTIRNTFLLFIRHPACDVFLQQPEQTKTRTFQLVWYTFSWTFPKEACGHLPGTRVLAERECSDFLRTAGSRVSELSVILEPKHHGPAVGVVVAQLCPTLRPQGLVAIRLLCPWDFPGEDTQAGYCFLLQEIFPTQGSNPCLLCLLPWQVGSLPLCHLGNSSPALRVGLLEARRYMAWVCRLLGLTYVHYWRPLYGGWGQWNWSQEVCDREKDVEINQL